MATRRSRLSIKPNLGGRGKSTSAPSVKPTEGPEKIAQSAEAAAHEDPKPPPREQTIEDAAETALKGVTESSSYAPTPNASDKCTEDITPDPHEDSACERNISQQPEPEAKEASTAKQDADKTGPPRVRSRFPKAKPNIGGDLSRQRKRHASVGHSDNEDELKKHPPPVQRVVTIATSTLSSSEVVTTDRVPFVPTQIPNSEKPVEADAVSHGRASKVIEKDEIPVKKAPVKTRRRKKVARSAEPPDKSKMTMKDLIYWNPTSNPMKNSDDARKKRKMADDGGDVGVAAVPAARTLKSDDVDQDETDQTVMAPQLKIGEDGEIILNEDSLMVDTAPPKYIYESNSDVVHETESRITSSSFRKRISTKSWTQKETAKFFKALSCVGTDFSMMSNLFPKRSRAELKNKYKREERCNKALVDKAVREQCSFDLSTFNLDDSESENREKGSKRTSKTKKSKNLDPVAKKGRKNTKVPSDNSDSDAEDNTAYNYRSTIEDRGSPSDNEELEILDHMSKRPTRSGRLPKPIVDFGAASVDAVRSAVSDPVSVKINGKKVVSTSVSRPPNVVRLLPSSTIRMPGSKTPDLQLHQRPPTSSPIVKSPGFMALSQQVSDQITVNQLSPGQLVFVQSSQPSGSEVLHVYVVSPSGVLNRSAPVSIPQQTSPRPSQTPPADTLASPVKTDIVPGQSLLKSPQTKGSENILVGIHNSDATVECHS